MVPSLHTSIKEGAMRNLNSLYITGPKDITSHLHVPYKMANLSCLNKIHEKEKINRHQRNHNRG